MPTGNGWHLEDEISTDSLSEPVTDSSREDKNPKQLLHSYPVLRILFTHEQISSIDALSYYIR